MCYPGLLISKRRDAHESHGPKLRTYQAYRIKHFAFGRSGGSAGLYDWGCCIPLLEKNAEISASAGMITALARSVALNSAPRPALDEKTTLAIDHV
jgi:hypothetical protein